MIEKERLEELIEQRAKIWGIGKSNNVFCVGLKFRDISLKNKEWLNNKLEVYSKFFETKEEAEWQLEFGNITRTDTLNLPTWEELKKKKEHYIGFTTKRGTKCWIAIDMPYRNDFGRILITYADIDKNYHIIYDKKLTKENYTLACRKAKELFLGEKENENDKRF